MRCAACHAVLSYQISTDLFICPVCNRRYDYNGKYWNSTQKVHSSPDQNASCSSGTPGEQARAYQVAREAASLAASLQGQLASQKNAMNPFAAGHVPQRKVPDEGIKLGEIMAYRLWRTVGTSPEHLISYAYPHGWPLHGLPFKADLTPRENGVHGIYSFQHHESVMKEIKTTGLQHGVGFRYKRQWGAIIWGTVRIWGQVIQHETGYRSEFASILSLDGGTCSRKELKVLQSRYLPREEEDLGLK